MGNRKDKPPVMRLLFSLSAFALMGSVIYIIAAGFNAYSSVILVSAVLGLGVPSVASGDGLLDMVSGFFECFFEGIVDVVAGIAEAIGSLFG